MGGNFSIIKSNEEINKNGIIELFNKMDSIASDYIITESFTDMHNLLEDDYCSKLVVLTSDILSTKLKPYEISYLDNRIKMGSDVTTKMVKEDIAHFNKNTIEELDIKDVEKTPNFILNKFLYVIFSIESYLLKIFNFPFGISIYVLLKND